MEEMPCAVTLYPWTISSLYNNDDDDNDNNATIMFMMLSS